MNVLVLGAGGVGESICALFKRRENTESWLGKVILADYDYEKAVKAAKKLNDPEVFVAERVDALKKEEIVALAKKYDVGFMVHCLITEGFTEVIMDACLECNCHFVDMALSETVRDPENPTKIIQELGHGEFLKSDEFEKRGLFAFVACGVEPGMIDYFARYAENSLFDDIEGLYVRDGSNLIHPEKDFVFGFSVSTTIMECLYGPHLYSAEKGIYSDSPLTHTEEFWLPGGIGMTRMSAVEHSEPLNMARHIKGIKEADFKIGYGKEFEDAMKYLKELGLLSNKEIELKGKKIVPVNALIDLLEVVAPEPKEIGQALIGKTCAGLWVKGKKAGMERQVYIYQVADNQDCVKKYGTPAVVAQTAVVPAIVVELVARGKMEGPFGVRVSEEFNPMPVLALLEPYGFPAGIHEMESEYREAKEEENFKKYLV